MLPDCNGVFFTGVVFEPQSELLDVPVNDPMTVRLVPTSKAIQIGEDVEAIAIALRMLFESKEVRDPRKAIGSRFLAQGSVFFFKGGDSL